MKTINLIGFERGNGIHWKHKPDDYHYEPIALVKNNGKIVWYADKQKLPADVILRILFSAREKGLSILMHFIHITGIWMP